MKRNWDPNLEITGAVFDVLTAEGEEVTPMAMAQKMNLDKAYSYHDWSLSWDGVLYLVGSEGERDIPPKGDLIIAFDSEGHWMRY